MCVVEVGMYGILVATGGALENKKVLAICEAVNPKEYYTSVVGEFVLVI